MQNEQQLLAGKTPVIPDTNDKRFKKIGLFVIIVFVAIFIIWGSLAKLSSAVPAPGRVSVALNHKTIQHLEGGIVKEIFIKDGDHVNDGQTLIVLENAKAASELGAIESQYLEMLAMEARLVAERDGKKEPIFDKEFSAKGNEALKESLMKNQRYEFSARRGSFESELKVFSERKAQLRQQMDGLRSVISAKEELLRTYKEEVKELNELFKEQLIDKLRLRDASREMTRLVGDIAAQKADLARAAVQMAEVDAQILARKKEYQKDIGATLRDVQTKLTDYRARVVALRDSLNRTEIKSPVSGRVVGLSVHTVGGVIPSGKPIMDIVPDGEHLVVSCRVDPANVSYIHKGLQAQITFPGFSHIKSLKHIEGRVIDVSADTLYDEVSRMSYYEVKVELTKEGEAELLKHKLQLIPGMPADAMIITGERTLVEYLIKPVKDMFIKGMREQ